MNSAELAETLGLCVPAIYVLMLAAEARWPARMFPPRRGWRWLGILFLLIIGTVGTVLPLLLPLQWLAAHRWFDGTGLGVGAGVVVGWLVLSLVAYAYHRLSHAWSPLWRLSHQFHHAPQRVDISGSVLFHPLEMVIQLLWQLFVTVIVLGLDPVAAAGVGVLQAFAGMFQHWNVHTPTWLGYLIQRPEAHCVHHRRGVHAMNYSDFPLWDMVFGSFRNPRHFIGEVGFEMPSDRQVGAMLAFADVNAARYGAGNRGAKPRVA
jgi:sterol desaturase/sphingolipid hydroxylase (fatty acid hydroxylase superfamily)